jgi:hypothetical protein
METHTTQGSGENDAQTSEQLKQLSLEIKSLTQRSERENKLLKYTPAITALLAVAGFFFTVWQAQRNDSLQREERTKERINRIQSQIRADKEQIVEFISDNKISTVRVAFLLSDLNSLISQLPQREPEMQDVTKLLADAAWDLRFDEQRHIDLDVLALRRWPDYRRSWSSNQDSHRVFLSQKYYPPMARIHAQDPQCVENLRYSEEAARYVSRGVDRECEDGLFPILLYGLAEHFEVLKEAGNRELLSKEIWELVQMTNNAAFTQQLSTTYLK